MSATNPSLVQETSESEVPAGTLRVTLPPEPEPGPGPGRKTPSGGGRRRQAPPPSATNLKVFSLMVGATIGLTTGLLARHVLHWSRLDGTLSPMTLGFVGIGWGLSAAYLLSRLMLVAREGTIRVPVGGKTMEFPLRRRPEVLARACQYLGGLVTGFLLALAGAWYLLAPRMPSLGRLQPGWTGDLQASLVALAAALLCLAFGEWVFRLTRKEGCTDHSPFVMIPSVLAMGASLAGAV